MTTICLNRIPIPLSCAASSAFNLRRVWLKHCNLTEYWLGVAAKRDFALDQISIVPDHIHLIARIVPKMSIQQVALLLMNNGQYFIGKRYPELLVQLGMTQLWNPSAYAGTCGEITTGLIMKWLQSDE